MSDYRDPDPRTREVDPRTRDYDDRYVAEGGSPPWGWIAGAIFAFLVLAVIFTYGSSGTQTAATPPRPAATTTGMAPPASPVPPITQAPPASTAPRTTNGQGAQ